MKHWKTITLGALFVFALAALALRPAIRHQPGRLSESTATAKTNRAAQEELQKTLRLFAGCGTENKGPFDGKLLYKCVFNYAQTRELSLIAPADRQKFIATWEHKHDNDHVLDRQETALAAINEMVTSLGQMHTAFLDRQQFSELQNHLNASLSGIGAYVMQKGVASRLQALGENASPEQIRQATKISAETPAYFFPAPVEGTPAAFAGIKSGDRIKSIGDRAVDGLTLVELSAALQGESGTKVRIVLERESGAGKVEVPLEITRAKITVPLISTANLDGTAPANIALFKLSAFVSRNLDIRAGQTLFKLCTGVDLQLNKEGGIDFPDGYDADRDCKLKGLVLDLRDDGGGRVDYAVTIAQLLLDHGPLVSMLERHGEQIVETKIVLEANALVTETFANGEFHGAKAKDRYMRLLPRGLPVVVLINKHSASASEMVAGLLQKNGAALVVGTPSYGKEVGQDLIPLAFGTAFKTTVLRFKPGGEDLGAAVMPDFVIEQTTVYLDDPASAEDVQQSKALELIRQQIESTATKTASQEKVRLEHAARDQRTLSQAASGVRK